MPNKKYDTNANCLYKNHITLEKIKCTLCPDKTNKDFVNLVFKCLKDPHQLTFIDSFGEKHLPSFMKGNHDGQKRLNVRKLKLWSESICKDSVFLEMTHPLTAISDAQKITERHAVYQLLLSDKQEMPDTLFASIEAWRDEQNHGKALLLMILWSIYGKEYIDILYPLYQNSSKSRNLKSIELLSHIKPCRPIFIGRDEIITKIENSFSSGKQFLFLQGMGGIGKSECAKQYAERFQYQYDTIIFAEYSDSIVNLINDNSVFTLTPPFILEKTIAADGIIESDYDYYKRKLTQIRLSSSVRTLIILDNLDEFDPELELVLNGPFRLIITTRWQSQNVYPKNTIVITEIQNKKTLKEIFSAHYGRDIMNDVYVDQMIDLFQGHTMALELIAKQMKASCLDSRDMLSNIKSMDSNQSATTNMSEKFLLANYSTRSMDFAYYIQRLFNVAELTEEEKNILMYLSLVPISGINKKIFKESCGLKDYSNINNLVERSWIRDVDGMISIHTLVKEAVRYTCNPNLYKCRIFIEGMIKTIPAIKCYYFNRTEKAHIEKIALHMYRIYPEPIEDFFDFYEWMELIFSHCCQYAAAVELEEKLLTIYRNQFGEENFRTARMVCRNACQLIHYFDSKTAITMFEESRNIIKSLKNLSAMEELYISDIDIELAKEYLEMFEENHSESTLKKIQDFCHEVILIRKKYKNTVQNPFYVTCILAYHCLAWIEIIRQNYVKVEEYLQLASEEGEKSGTNLINAFSFHIDSRIEIARDNTVEGIKCMKMSIEFIKQYFGVYDSSFIKRNIELGELYEQCGMLNDAYLQYQQTYNLITNMPKQEQKLITFLENRLEHLKGIK